MRSPPKLGRPDPSPWIRCSGEGLSGSRCCWCTRRARRARPRGPCCRNARFTHGPQRRGSRGIRHWLDRCFGPPVVPCGRAQHPDRALPVRGRHGRACRVVRPAGPPCDDAPSPSDDLLLVPAAMEALLDGASLTPADLGSLGALNCGSSVVPEELIRRFNAPRSSCGAGSTGRRRPAPRQSCSTTRTPTRSDHAASQQDTATFGSSIPPERTSRRAIRGSYGCGGPTVFTHYWNRPDETEQAFSDGWYRTGDLGRADEHGFIYVTGRMCELIISGGENIYPAEARVGA